MMKTSRKDSEKHSLCEIVEMFNTFNQSSEGRRMVTFEKIVVEKF